MSGYGDAKAKGDLEQFFAMIDRPRGIHLCGNPDWDFLLNQDLDILSLDLYTNRAVFPNYVKSIKRFLDRGGVLAWGIVPTNAEPFASENIDSLADQLESAWRELAAKGVDLDQLLAQSLISPATCCLVNPDIERTVEAGFAMVARLSARLREKYRLP
jgi:hypothetical protein